VKHIRLDELFSLEVARSRGAKAYEPGRVPFVTSTVTNNGVDRYVEPLDGDRVFDGPAMAISGLGFATLQLERFLPKGNGGDSLTILSPRGEMPVGHMLGYVAAFNQLHGWRFSYGRKAKVDRLVGLALPAELPSVQGVLEGEAKRLQALTGRLQRALAGSVVGAEGD
jgi:hypothetical protein